MFVHILSYPRRAWAAYTRAVLATRDSLLDWLGSFVTLR